MRMTFKAFSKALFGVKYEKLTRTIFIYLLMFWGLRIADFKVRITLPVLYIMVTAVTTGVMWQALSSENNAANIQSMVMLPVERRKFVFPYIGALGIYTFLTKTAALLAVLLAVSVWSWMEILGSILCAVNAILMTAAVFSLKKYWYAGSLWTGGEIAAVLCLWNKPWFILLVAANGAVSILLLLCADGYSFCFPKNNNKRTVKRHRHFSVWRYLFRYLKTHKNYLVNTGIMWCAACVLPLFFKQMENLFVIPLGFAILSLNTPICILVSCDTALEQAFRFLPGQRKAFCVPYCLFIFSCNIIADLIFLCSIQIQKGGVDVLMIAAAVFFALQSAVCSVLLEWFYPIRKWNIESDLWHHPRKYMVPAAMIFLAGAVGTMPIIVFPLVVLLFVEITVLLILCWRLN